MKLLLTNDDGVHAPGLDALLKAVDGLADPIVIAPSEATSGCSHSATTDRPFRVVRLAENRLAVEGTPADCVRVGIHRWSSEVRWVLSGINDGGNLGVDVYHSGTVAAVREAALRGVPGVALSQYHSRPLTAPDWQRAAQWAKPLLAELMANPWTPGTFWNVNFPCPPDGSEETPDVVFCPLEPAPLPLSFREDDEIVHYSGTYSLRERQRGTDVEVCFGGKIAVTQVSVMEASR